MSNIECRMERFIVAVILLASVKVAEAQTTGACGNAIERPVIRVIRGEATELVTVTFGTESVTCTRRHPFYVVDKGWAEAGDLHEGDLVPTATGEPKEISALTIRTVPNAIPVYNFLVEQYHYYFVGDGQFLVHNGKM